MKFFFDSEDIEVGIDEAGRGCLSGPVFVSAVILPKTIDDNIHTQIKDSKKLSKKKRTYLRDYIESVALDFAVVSIDNEEIDKINILNATLKGMHNALDKLNIMFDNILVDGTIFKPYKKNGILVPYKCVPNGDNTYYSIAAASILAKVYHDEYIQRLCDSNNDFKKYGWERNQCYGTKEHINAIKEYGITPFHRKTFGICKQYKNYF